VSGVRRQEVDQSPSRLGIVNVNVADSDLTIERRVCFGRFGGRCCTCADVEGNCKGEDKKPLMTYFLRKSRRYCILTGCWYIVQ
jgi:hypothetical protein